MRFAFAAIAAFALCGCALSRPAPETPANFDAAACYEREFDVYFESFDADLSPEARETIGAVAQSLQGCTIEHVRIIGLAGALGPEDQNMETSAQRAEVVAAYLVRVARWPRANMELLATGEAGATTDDGLNRPMRRRAHVRVRAAPPPAPANAS